MKLIAYMFENEEVTPTTWIELQGDESITCVFVLPNIALLLSEDKTEYCFVYFDEAGQCSNPYRTFDEAQHSFVHYVQHCL